MMESEVRKILEPVEDRYEIVSCGSCSNYLKDGLCAELKAKFPINIISPSVSFGSALITIDKLYVHVVKGFGDDIIKALSLIG